MICFKKLLATAAGLCFACTVAAQQHYNSWFRATCSVPVGKKINIDAELQHRLQNGWRNDDMLEKNLMYTFRNWIHYQYKEDIRFSVSPFAYFTHYRIIQTAADLASKPFHEIRFSAALDGQHKLPEKWSLTERNAIEYRMLSNRNTPIIRLRNRLGVQYPFTPQLKLAVYDELFCNIAGVSTAHFFDHNRIGFMLEYKMSRTLKLETGYIYINRLPLANDLELTEHNIILNLTYWFKKKQDKLPDQGQ